MPPLRASSALRSVAITRGAGLAAALLAILLPGAPSQALPGSPLNPWGLAVAAAAAYASLALPAVGRRTRWLLGIGLLLVALGKLGLVMLTPPVGLVATYWAGETTNAPPERSTELGRLESGATRVDGGLDFRGNAFPVHFFNDAARFNLSGDAWPSRDQLPFTVRWEGSLVAPEAGTRTLQVEAMGTARVWVNGAEVVALGPALTTQSALRTLDLTAGPHDLRVEYTRPAGRVPRLQVAWQPTPGAALEPIGYPHVYRAPVASGAIQTAVLVRGVGWALDAALLGLMAVWIGFGLAGLARASRGAGGFALAWWRPGLAALPLLFLAHGMLLHADLPGRATILSGGDDWFTYESSARDILLNGPLMTGGNDSAPPYYGQPLYPYALAVAHALTGEGLYGPLVLQFAAVGATLALAGALGAALFGRLGGLAALAGFWAFLQQEHLRIARQLLNENLYMPLVMAGLLVLVRLAQRRSAPPWWQALLAGLLLGIATATRSQFLLFLPAALAFLLCAWSREGRRLAAMAGCGLVLLGLAAAIVPFTWRNWVVSGQPVLLSTSGGATLITVHGPPDGFPLGSIGDDSLYEALGLDRDSRVILEYLRRDPVGYFGTWVGNGGHSIGLTGERGPDSKVRWGGAVYWGILATAVLYVAAVALLPRARRRETWPVHAFVLSHLVVMMAFEADAYGFRQPAPMYTPMAVVAAQVPLAAALWLLGRLRAPRPGLAPASLAAGATAVFALGALAQQGRGLADLLPRREIVYHGLGGMAAAAELAADRAGADVVYLASGDGGPRVFGAGNLPGLRFARLKWFDPSRSVPIPPPDGRALYALAEVMRADAGVTACLGSPDADGHLAATEPEVVERCVAGRPWTHLEMRFGSAATLGGVLLPATAEVGERVPVTLDWRVLEKPSGGGFQTFLHVLEKQPGSGTLWGNGTAVLYPASQWEPGERVVSVLPVPIDPTAVPDRYLLTLGFAPTGSGSPLPARWADGNGDRAPLGEIALRPSSKAATGQPELPAGMVPARGSAGGLALVATRTPPSTRPGERPTVSLLWKAETDGPRATQLRLALVRADGQVVQQEDLALLGGRFPVGELRARNVVRDDQTFVVSARAPAEELELRAELLDAAGATLPASEPFTLGRVRVEGRPRSFEVPRELSVRQRVRFGDTVELLGYRLDPSIGRPGQSFTVRLAWRGLAEMGVPYKVFVHVTTPDGTTVLGQRDAEPGDGEAPTTGWLPGEVIDDDPYRISLPPDIQPGDYPIAIGLYDPRTNERLALEDGETRLFLETRLRVPTP